MLFTVYSKPLKMLNFKKLFGALAAAGSVFQAVSAQGTAGTYTDPDTGIIFSTQSYADGAGTAGGFTVGMALPANAASVDATEYIGMIIGSRTGTTAARSGWSGIAHGPGMTTNLLLMVWPHQDKILTSFRQATGYDEPPVYNGNAKLSQISATVTDTSYKLIYRCENCLALDLSGETDMTHSTSGVFVLSWAQAFPAPTTPSNPNTRMLQHDNGFGIYGAPVAPMAQAKYAEWARLAVPPTSTTTSVPTSTETSPPVTTTAFPVIPVPTGTFDYIVVGGGAGGLPIADRMSETGKKTLLIERGPPSTGRWGGTMKPTWLEGTSLTRFDVPGLCNQIWVDSAGIACNDIDQMAGCVLGGGTAVNAALWWKPNPADWDYNFPNGWKASDMQSATNKVFQRIPGTDKPSMDGKRYLGQGENVIANGLRQGGWTEVSANSVPGQKTKTFSHAPFMFANGERGGPMATYLVSAAARSNFGMWTKTSVKRVIREGGHITGVEVEPYMAGGYTGIVKITPVTGRVILSAGTFGTAKILMRSGIGLADSLAIVKGSAKDGASMIDEQQWINLPVGMNLEDHTNTDVVVSHPDVVFYDFYEAYSDPNVTDRDLYLNKRSGILATAAPNIGPLFWDVIKGADGKDRQLQWTARVEGSLGAANGKTMTISQYLGRGAVSRGRLNITPSLNMAVTQVPYLRDPNDVAAVVKGIENLQTALKNVQGLTWLSPAPGVSAQKYVEDYVVATSNRRANHWIGTAKIGGDDGRNGGKSVIDLNTKVYGTDNLFVVDASIFPGMVTTNPSSLIVVAAEQAAAKIKALPQLQAVEKFQPCGGQSWNGSFVCKTGLTCKHRLRVRRRKPPLIPQF
ncbi:hypothetical protein V493_00537 [Pseudogymnoascus sp. VKM F-4281 (FW-2241)]|nr:hypothetical protein V493_00537 [Pseudogymnoascus sp. VKM F-4281 (FW-2241)]